MNFAFVTDINENIPDMVLHIAMHLSRVATVHFLQFGGHQAQFRGFMAELTFTRESRGGSDQHETHATSTQTTGGGRGGGGGLYS